MSAGIKLKKSAGEKVHTRMCGGFIVSAVGLSADKCKPSGIWIKVPIAFLAIFVFCGGCKPSVRSIERLQRRRDREAAVEKIADQSLLFEIAQTESLDSVHEAAIARLNDQSRLAALAMRGKSNNISYWAVQRITDQSLLKEVALYPHAYWSTRVIAFDKLTNQACIVSAALVMVFPRDKWRYRDHYADRTIAKLTDQRSIEALALNAEDLAIQFTAIAALENRVVLRRLACDTSMDDYIRKTSIVRLLLNDPIVERQMGVSRLSCCEEVSEKGGTVAVPIGLTGRARLISTGRGTIERELYFYVRKASENDGKYPGYYSFNATIRSIIRSLPPPDQQRVTTEYKEMLGM